MCLHNLVWWKVLALSDALALFTLWFVAPKNSIPPDQYLGLYYFFAGIYLLSSTLFGYGYKQDSALFVGLGMLTRILLQIFLVPGGIIVLYLLAQKILHPHCKDEAGEPCVPGLLWLLFFLGLAVILLSLYATFRVYQKFREVTALRVEEVQDADHHPEQANPPSLQTVLPACTPQPPSDWSINTAQVVLGSTASFQSREVVVGSGAMQKNMNHSP